MTRNNTLLAVVLLLAATLSWGGMFIVAKSALTVIDPYYITLIRYAPSAIVFMLLLYWFEGKKAFSFEGRIVSLFFYGTLGFAGFNLLVFNGLMYSRPEHAAVVMALMPMMTVILMWILKGQRPHPFTMIAVASAFSGVFLVISGGHPRDVFAGGAGQWDLMFLVGALCWVGYTMGAQQFSNWSPLRYTAITCGLGALSIGAITLALSLNGTIHPPTLQTLALEQWVIAYLVILGALVAVLSWNAGIKMLGSVNGVLFINFVPITAFTIGVISGRSFSTAEVVGASLVIGALIANNLFLRWQDKKLQSVNGVKPCCATH